MGKGKDHYKLGGKEAESEWTFETCVYMSHWCTFTDDATLLCSIYRRSSTLDLIESNGIGMRCKGLASKYKPLFTSQ